MEARTYDVVVVGGGGAGVTAAVSAAQAGARVAILSKEPIACGNTRLAFGGVAGVGLSPGDSPEELFRDIMVGGEGLGQPRLAQTLAQETAKASLVAEGLGHLFRRDEQGDIKGPALGRTGGHRFHRGISSPAQGASLGQVLHDAAFRSQVDILEETVTFKLLVRGGVRGLMAFDLRRGEVLALSAGAVVLACGGAGWLYYPHTDCLRPSTGDGFALALEAGAELMGMEFMQFIPFAITHPASYTGILLGEPSSAGPHGRLINGKGQVVLEGMMRMTRSQVARVLGMEISAGNTTPHGGLSLDLSPNLDTLEGKEAWRKLKKISFLDPVKAVYGQKAFRWEEPWDVAPTAHFSVGGVRMDERCRTALEGLYAAGEVAGGAHGADRLGSMALAEIFVFGWKAGQEAATFARGRPPIPHDEREEEKERQSVEALFGRRGKHRPIALMARLQKVMWEKVGVVRTGETLRQALEDMDGIERDSQDLSIAAHRVYNTEVTEALELKMMLTTARAIALSALERQESRGGHIRLDFPQRDDARWLRNIILWKEGSGLRLRGEGVSGGPRL